MDEKLTSKASHRISGTPVPVGRVSNSSAQPGQNGGFSDGFPTKTPSIPAILGNPEKPLTHRTP